MLTILGDSLALPRPDITWKDLYCSKLQDLLGARCQIVNRARRNNTVVRQTNETEEGFLIEEVLYMSESDYFIVHLGIVDCAPRLFTESQRSLIHHLQPALVRNALIGFMSERRYTFTKLFPKVYVSRDVFLERFTFLLDTITHKTGAKKIFVINIAKTSYQNDRRSYNFNENIRGYNQLISECINKYAAKVELLDMYSLSEQDPELLYADGIHLSRQAHTMIAEYIYSQISASGL